MYRCAYFNIKELVSPIVYNKFGDRSWMFFSPEVLADLDIIRETWGSSIIINDWSWGGNLKQCGLRSNLDQLVKDKTITNNLYISAHMMGKGFDLHDKLNRNPKLYEHIRNLIYKKKLNSFKRLENLANTTGWVHVDSYQTDSGIVF